MSGIFGFVADRCVGDPGARMQRMVDAVGSSRPPAKRCWTSPGGSVGLGALRPPGADVEPYFATDPETGIACAVDGVVYRDGDEPHGGLVEANPATALINRYSRSGPGCLREVKGSFSVAWWEERENRLVLANDKVATNLLFYAQHAGTLVFASTLARILKAGTFTPELDPEGLVDLLAFKHILGPRTLFRSAYILPPASILTLERGVLRVERYWRLEEVEAHGRYDESRLEELEAVFKRAVSRALRPDGRSAVTLTGGLDSRCIVAAAANQGLSHLTFCEGQPNGTDVVLAREIAARVGSRHVQWSIDPERLGEWLIPMVTYQGGVVSTLDSHPCQYLDVELPFDAIVSGVTGEIARSVWVSPADLGVRDVSGAMAILERHIKSTTARRLDLTSLWRPEYRALVRSAPTRHLLAIVSGYRCRGSYAAACDYFDLGEYTRKFLGKGYHICRAKMDSYRPYLDQEWIEAILAVPLRERVTKRIQIDLIRRLYPALLDTVYTKTSLPMSASPWRVAFSDTLRRIKRGGARRLGLGSQKGGIVETYDYLRWSRNEMRSTLVGVLYDPRAAFREFLLWNTVEPLLEGHFSGKEDWPHLVSALAVFEIAHRLWCENGAGAGEMVARSERAARR